MKNLRQIRETKVIIEENVDAEERKLSALVRAGLFDAKKLPALKRAMEKSVDKMTAQEKRMLLNLLDQLMNQVLSNQSVYQKVKQNVMKEDLEHLEEIKDYTSKDINDLPNIILLRRRAVRVFPDGQKVVMYWADKINRYVPIPVSPGGISLVEATYDYLHKQYLSHINSAASHEDEDHPDVAVHLDKAERVLRHIKKNFGNENRIRTQAVGKQIKKEAEKRKDYEAGKKMRGEKGILATAGRMASSGQRAAALGTVLGGAIGSGIRSLSKKMTTEGIETTRIKMKKIRVSPLRGVVKSPMSNMKEEQLDENIIAKAFIAAAPRVISAGKNILGKGKQVFNAWKKTRADRATKKAAEVEKNVAKRKDIADKRARDAARQKEVKDLAKKEKGSGPKSRRPSILRRMAAGIGGAAAGAGLAGTSNSETNAGYQTQRREVGKLQGQSSFATNAKQSDFETRRAKDTQLQRKAFSINESNINILKSMEEGTDITLSFGDNSQFQVNYLLAQKIINIYESINKNNKQLMANMLNESVDSFKKISNFAISNGK